MTHSAGVRHIAFRASRGPVAVQLRMTAAVAVALLIGIGLGVASIAPRSGWHIASAPPAVLAHDAWLPRLGSARG